MRLRRGCAAGAPGFVLLLCVAANGLGATPADGLARRSITIGRSVAGRSIRAVETGDFHAERRVLVVGCIHGNEPAGTAVADLLSAGAPPPELDLWP